MFKSKSKSTLLLVLGILVLTLITGCQAILPTAQILSQMGTEGPITSDPTMDEAAADVDPTVAATAEPTATAPVEPTAAPTIAPTESPLPTDVLTDTAALTETVAMTEATAMTETMAMTETVAMTATTGLTESMALTESMTFTETEALTPTADVTESVAVTATAAVTETVAAPVTEDEPAVERLPVVDTATVLVRSLRIRSGPGTEFDVVDAAVAGERYSVTGQTLGCQWYRIDHPELGVAWLGGGDLAVADGDCTDIPDTTDPDATATDATESDATEASADDSAADDAVATVQPSRILQPTPVSTPTPQPTTAAAEPAPEATTQAATDAFPADRGCLVLQNQLGPDLSFIFTNDDDDFTDTVQVSSEQDVTRCFEPGDYAVTVKVDSSSPSPWSDYNTTFTLAAGDRFFFPIRPQ